MEEIRRCRLLSPRANFLLLLGTRYGYRPLPEELPPSLHTRFAAALALRADDGASLATMLEEWYPLDPTSCRPRACSAPRRLQPRGILVDGAAVLGPALRAVAAELRGGRRRRHHARPRRQVGDRAGGAARHAFRRRSGDAHGVLQPDDLRLHARDAGAHCYVDQKRVPPSEAAPGGWAVDDEAAVLREDLRGRVRAFLPAERFWEHEAAWQPSPAEAEGDAAVEATISTDHRVARRAGRGLPPRAARRRGGGAGGGGGGGARARSSRGARHRGAESFVGRSAEVRLCAVGRAGAAAAEVVAAASGGSRHPRQVWASLRADPGRPTVVVGRFCGITATAAHFASSPPRSSSS